MTKRTGIQMRLPNTYVMYGVVVALNLILNLVLPANAGTMAAYHLSTTQYRILIELIEIPLAAIWLTAFYGYRMLSGYSTLIKKTEEGKGFWAIKNGLAWLAWGSPLGSILSLVLYAIFHVNSGFYTTAIIVNHYVSLLVAVVAFTLIANGTHTLAGRNYRPSAATLQVIVAALTAFGALYVYFTLNQVRGVTLNSFRLPVLVILLTIMVPYLYAWYMGAYAAYEILLFRQQSKGLIYKRALSYIAGGIATIIASSIIVEFLTSSTKYLTRLTLNGVLLVVYIFLILSAVGYVLVALGTKRLKKIEEV